MHEKIDAAATWDFVTAYLTGLAARLDGGAAVTPDWGTLGSAIGSLPLATSDFAVISNRLSAARGYLDLGEPGAATYELRLLGRQLGHLRRCLGW